MKTMSLCVGTFGNAGDLSGGWHQLSLRVVRETAKAYCFAPDGKSTSHTLWLPKSAVSEVYYTNESLGVKDEFAGYELASWFTPDSWQVKFISMYASTTAVTDDMLNNL